VQPVLVTAEGDRLAGQVEVPLVGGAGYPRVVGGLERQPGEVDRLVGECAAGVEPGEQQQVIDQPAHPLRRGLHAAQRVAGVLRGAQAEFSVAADAGDRGAQFMARVGDELAQLVFAGLPAVERVFDVAKHPVERRAELADFGPGVGVGHPVGQVG